MQNEGIEYEDGFSIVNTAANEHISEEHFDTYFELGESHDCFELHEGPNYSILNFTFLLFRLHN